MSEQVEAYTEKPEVHLEDLEYSFLPFAELGDEALENKVMRDYMEGWKEPLSEERRLGIIKTPLEEEVWNRWNSELYKEIFTSGQMVLTANIKGEREPVMSIRSLIWKIPNRAVLKTNEYEGTELEGTCPPEQMSDIRIKKIPKECPQTWYEASNNGHGYTTIQMLENGARKECAEADYEKVLSPETRKEETMQHNLVLVNYALTANRHLPYKIKGAMKALVTEREGLARKSGLGCDTYTPADGLARHLSKLQVSDEEFERNKEFLARRYIEVNILTVAAKRIRAEIRDAATMHLMQGANFVGYALEARHDPRSKNVCIVTSYLL